MSLDSNREINNLMQLNKGFTRSIYVGRGKIPILPYHCIVALDMSICTQSSSRIILTVLLLVEYSLI